MWIFLFCSKKAMGYDNTFNYISQVIGKNLMLLLLLQKSLNEFLIWRTCLIFIEIEILSSIAISAKTGPYFAFKWKFARQYQSFEIDRWLLTQNSMLSFSNSKLFSLYNFNQRKAAQNPTDRMQFFSLHLNLLNFFIARKIKWMNENVYSKCITAN